MKLFVITARYFHKSASVSASSQFFCTIYIIRCAIIHLGDGNIISSDVRCGTPIV